MDWIAYIKRSENEALTDIYQQYASECISYISSKFSLDYDASLEIFQLTVIILYDNVTTGKLTELTGQLKTYLIGIARNKAYEQLRKKKTTSLDAVSYAIDSYVMSDEEDIVEEQLRQADRSLDELGDPCKTLLSKYYYQRYNMERIAAEMGYSNADSAKNQKYKCLKRLQKIFFSHTSTDQQV